MINNITISELLEFSNEAADCAVIFDIFRASNTILSILKSDPKYLFIFSSIDEYYNKIDKIKEFDENYLLFTEKDVERDFDNSPSNAINLDLTDKTVVCVTSNGTKAIIEYSNNENIKDILIGSSNNIKSLKRYILNSSYENIILEAVGRLYYKERAIEDYLIAKFVESKLLNKSMKDFYDIKYEILETTKIDKDIKNFLKYQKMEKNITDELLTQLTEDIKLCLSLDKLNYLGKIHKLDDLICIKKIIT